MKIIIIIRDSDIYNNSTRTAWIENDITLGRFGWMQLTQS